MNALKHKLKSVLRPLYRRLPASWQTRMRAAYRKLIPPTDPRLAPYPRSLRPLLAYLQENERLLLGRLQENERLLLGCLQENERLMLALLKSAHTAAPRPPAPGFQAAPLGGHRLLAAHPTASFLYLDSRDVAVVPPIILNRYETGIQRALEQLVGPGSAALEVRARHGFHTLTLAHLVSPGGRVVAFEPDDVQRQVLRDNLAAHDLGAIVTVHEPSGEAQAFPGGEALGRLERRPDLIRLDVAGQVESAVAGLSDLLAGAPTLRMVLTLPGGCPAEGPLRRLAHYGMRFWRIDPEGGLEECTAEQALGSTRQGRIDLVAARSLP